MACSCVFAGIVVMVILCDSIISITYSSPWLKTDSGLDVSPSKVCASGSESISSWCHAIKWRDQADAFKIATVLCGLASTALFVAICASCGICCNCCRNKVPTIMIMVCATVASVLLLIAGIAFAGMKKNTEEKLTQTGKLSYGFAMTFVAAVLLLLIPCLAYVIIKKQGDIVHYTPKVAMIVPPHSYPGYSTYPGYGGQAGYAGQPGYGQPAYGGQPGPAWGAAPQQGKMHYEETSYPA